MWRILILCLVFYKQMLWNAQIGLFQHHSGVYNDCKDALTQGHTTSGVYHIQPDNQPAFQAYCNMTTDNGGWTVFQRRMDGSVDFYRYWSDYQQGFGNLSGEFWLGLDKIHRLTSTATRLRVDMQDFDGNSAYAQYTSFSFGDSSSKYILSVSGYSELQETLLITKMDRTLVQEIKTMMQQVKIVHSATKVAGGITDVINQTSMVSTMVDHTHPMLMVWTGTHGRDTITP